MRTTEGQTSFLIEVALHPEFSDLQAEVGDSFDAMVPHLIVSGLLDDASLTPLGRHVLKIGHHALIEGIREHWRDQLREMKTEAPA